MMLILSDVLASTVVSNGLLVSVTGIILVCPLPNILVPVALLLPSVRAHLVHSN